MGSLNPLLLGLVGMMIINGALAVLFGVRAKRAFQNEGRLTRTLAAWSGIAMHGHAVLTLAVAWLDRGSLYESHLVTAVVGGIITIAGAAAIALGRIAYGNQQRVYGLLEDRIIADGIYRWSRNPQYLGYALIFTGIAIVTGSSLAFVFTVVFITLIHAGVTLIEEPHLQEKFGREYRDYRNQTSRYLSLSRRA